MTLSELIQMNQSFSTVIAQAKHANKELKEKNQTMRLLVHYLNDVQNKIHQAIGEATASGKL
tara:strand:+ start:59 stop:244 length:186 start_codon:yes stop_codon:yes gene_type:complete